MKKALVGMLVLIIVLLIGMAAQSPKASGGASADPAVLTAFDELKDYISNLPDNVLKKGQRTSLVMKLKNAKRIYKKGKPCTAANKIQAYLNHTQALHKGKRLEIAEDLYNRGWTLLYDLIMSLPEGKSCRRFPRFEMEPTAEIVESNNKHLKGMFTFGQPRLQTVEAEGEQFTQMNMPDIDPVGEPGMPGVPVFRRLIAVPWDAEVSVVATPRGRHTIQNINLYPFQGEAIDELELPPPEYFADPPFTKNEEVYASDTLVPEDIVTVTPIGNYRDLQMAQLEIATGQYNPVNRTLTLYETVEVEVSYQGGPGFFTTEGSYNPFEIGPRKVFEEAALNSSVIPEYVGPREFHVPTCIGEELLILTHPDFRTAADDLAQHKRDNGIPTSVFEVNDGTNPGPDTGEEIDDFIEDRYYSCLVRPSYVLLMGDTEFVPTFLPPEFDNLASDYKYAILNGCLECHTPNALVRAPDFAVGRISVDTQIEAQTVVDKIIDYESNPPVPASFYKNISIASLFQCCRMHRNGNPLDGQAGTDQRGFIETSELVRDELLNQGYTVERIYTETVDNGNPCLNPPICDQSQAPYNGNTTPRRYFDGTLLPAAIGAASGFPWNGDTQDIIDAFNDGRFLIFHRDHGSRDGWGHPGLTSDNVTNDLTNGDLLPVVFSINCQTAWFDTNESFAERLLRLDNGGAVGVVGATRNSPSWTNNALCRGLFDAVWPNTESGFGGNTSIRRLGDILNHSKLYVLNQIGVAQTAGSISQGSAERELYLYHVLGDPTLEMWTSKPLMLLKAYVLEWLVNRLRVSYAVEGAVITAIQENNPIGRAAVVNGEAELEFVTEPNPEIPIKLSASKPNYVSVRLPTCYPNLPSPNLVYTGSEDYIGSDGKEYTRYNLEVTNSGDYPDELFEPAPHLPPCGLNTNAARTWADIYDNENNRLYGFCALSSSDGLKSIWFSRLRGVPPPVSVYVELTDRECDITYTSNLAVIGTLPIE